MSFIPGDGRGATDRRGRYVREVLGDAGGVDDIEQGELRNQRRELEEEGQRLRE